MDVGAGGDDLCRLVRNPAQHHRRAGARASSRPLMATTSAVDRLRSRIGHTVAPISATVEAGHLKRFTEAIGDPNPRWNTEAPPTYLVALVPASMHLAEAEEYGKGWLNGGNPFEYVEPVRVGDRITASARGARVYQKTGTRGALLFLLFQTDYVNPHPPAVARARGAPLRGRRGRGGQR